MSTKESKIKFLADQLSKHSNLYYNQETQISDASFDAQEKALKQLDPDHSFFKNVGAPLIQEEWKKASHEIPLGSLNKAKDPQELAEWLQSKIQGVGPVFKNNTLLVTEKLDGLSIEVIYNNGIFKNALTRGDGLTGFAIGANVIKMGGIHAKLDVPFTGSLRGEILLRKSQFSKISQSHDYSNTRNAASGISKRLDGTGCEYLDVLFYQAIGNVEFETEHSQFEFLQKKLHLQTPNYCLVRGKLDQQILDITKIWNLYQDKTREQLDWDLDGLVIRINELADQKALGHTHHRPHGAIALKFKSESAETIVRQITVQVGNSGRLTPVIEFDTVNLVGADINRASLYNFGYIEEIGLDVGAKVLIVRANDVIPRCEVVLEPTGSFFKPPTHCPACNGQVLMNGENLQCTNSLHCPAQVIGRLQNWINTLGILEWGDKLLEKLVAAELVNNISDLYRLSTENLSSLERMGEKSANNCYTQLWSYNPIELSKFLGGLSIPMIGTSSIDLIVNSGLDTLEKIRHASCDEFLAIKGLGPIRAQGLHEGLHNNSDLIDAILATGLKIVVRVEPTIVLKSSKLKDKIICITGSTNIKRSDLIDMIETNGGTFKNSVNKECTYLVLADPSKVSSKTKNATKLGVQIISEQDLLEMLQ